MDDLFIEIRPIIAKRLRLAEERVVMSANFRDDFGADSIDLVELVMTLESIYEVEFSDEIVEEITTVAEAVEYLAKLLK